MMGDKEWYFNTVTGKVELGPQSPMAIRLGPYKTKEEAEKALDIAEERNKEWENQEREWKQWPKDAAN
ncbi:hypothetical protein [Bifidobacterium choloepi]|uniref:SPOR domain-containing protein n=1 Tax=Bifidobacterium choloepi TaxID=2614131 RepID=A0A6I5MZR8_9BIFI|nr:hypothetical protein [Bifidobacterium choloepi]NEG70158.1 hypothetical protein [Bifidobacterium choloepi]